MTSIGTLLESPLAINLAIWLAGTALTAFTGSQWWRARKAEKWTLAYEAIEAGVTETYETFVRTYKKEHDGGLPDSARREAHQKAIRLAQEYGRANGVNTRQVIGEKFIDVTVEQAVRDAKGGTS